MPEQADVGALTLAVGEMRGQLREMIHGQNNMAQKVDLLAEKAWQAPTAAQYDALSKRIDALEADKDRNDGAKGVLSAVLKSPTFGWVVGIVATAFAAIKGGLFK